MGPGTARTLCAYGLDTVGRLAAAPLGTLQRLTTARTGRELHEKARGIDRTPVVRNAAAQSLAAERLFGRDELDRDSSAAPCSPSPPNWDSGCAARTR